MQVVTGGGGEMKEYDHVDYEQLLFHFQTVTRTTYWEHDLVDSGLDHCFDCASEV